MSRGGGTESDARHPASVIRFRLLTYNQQGLASFIPNRREGDRRGQNRDKQDIQDFILPILPILPIPVES